MKKVLILLAGVMLLAACGDSEKQLRDRAAELCLTEGWTQELTAQDNYRPDFTQENNPFEK